MADGIVAWAGERMDRSGGCSSTSPERVERSAAWRFVIDRYIVDLYCAARRLVVEVDGGVPTNAESSTPNAIVSFIHKV
jgi:hypothetical protein